MIYSHFVFLCITLIFTEAFPIEGPLKTAGQIHPDSAFIDAGVSESRSTTPDGGGTTYNPSHTFENLEKRVSPEKVFLDVRAILLQALTESEVGSETLRFPFTQTYLLFRLKASKALPAAISLAKWCEDILAAKQEQDRPLIATQYLARMESLQPSIFTRKTNFNSPADGLSGQINEMFEELITKPGFITSPYAATIGQTYSLFKNNHPLAISAAWNLANWLEALIKVPTSLSTNLSSYHSYISPEIAQFVSLVKATEATQKKLKRRSTREYAENEFPPLTGDHSPKPSEHLASRIESRAMTMPNLKPRPFCKSDASLNGVFHRKTKPPANVDPRYYSAIEAQLRDSLQSYCVQASPFYSTILVVYSIFEQQPTLALESAHFIALWLNSIIPVFNTGNELDSIPEVLVQLTEFVLDKPPAFSQALRAQVYDTPRPTIPQSQTPVASSHLTSRALKQIHEKILAMLSSPALKDSPLYGAMRNYETSFTEDSSARQAALDLAEQIKSHYLQTAAGPVPQEFHEYISLVSSLKYTPKGL
ncbi:MAG: hypothetical protein M1829_001833 [Trizodia sp. TS-e1964]|nr:MAG: hypothetical protein M1829_001833 [Trizodia sp. TS-e1964]